MQPNPKLTKKMFQLSTASTARWAFYLLATAVTSVFTPCLAAEKNGVEGLPDDAYASMDKFDCYEAAQHRIPGITGDSSDRANDPTRILYHLCTSKDFNSTTKKFLNNAYEEFVKRILSEKVYDCVRSSVLDTTIAQESYLGFVRKWVLPTISPHDVEETVAGAFFRPASDVIARAGVSSSKVFKNSWVFLSPMIYMDKENAFYADSRRNSFFDKKAQLEGKKFEQHVSIGVWTQALNSDQGPASTDIDFWTAALALAHFKTLGLSNEIKPDNFTSQLASCIAFNGQVPENHSIPLEAGSKK